MATIALSASFMTIATPLRKKQRRIYQYKYMETLRANNNDGDIEGDGSFMKSLRERIDQVNDRDTKIPIVVLDSMLPRQVFKIETDNEIFTSLIQNLLADENPSFGMIGMASPGLIPIPLAHGVEVLIRSAELIDDEPQQKLRVELLGGERIFRIQGEISKDINGRWTEARVGFISYLPEDDPTAAVASMKAEESIVAAGLVEKWTKLARVNERQPGQIDRLLLQLGKMPPVEKPSNLAFWIGALVNPLPGMGVAKEIRPKLLTAESAEERVAIAFDGIRSSITHMDGSKPMW